MITKPQLQRLKTICRYSPEGTELLSLVDAVETTCKNCTEYRGNGYCDKWEMMVPDNERNTGCEAWECLEIPF